MHLVLPGTTAVLVLPCLLRTWSSGSVYSEQILQVNYVTEPATREAVRRPNPGVDGGRISCLETTSTVPIRRETAHGNVVGSIDATAAAWWMYANAGVYALARLENKTPLTDSFLGEGPSGSLTLLKPGLMGANAGFEGGSGLGETTTTSTGAGAGTGAGATSATAAGSSAASGTSSAWLVRSEAGATLTARPLELAFVKTSGMTILLRGPSLGLARSLPVLLPTSAMVLVDRLQRCWGALDPLG